MIHVFPQSLYKPCHAYKLTVVISQLHRLSVTQICILEKH